MFRGGIWDLGDDGCRGLVYWFFLGILWLCGVLEVEGFRGFS